MTALLYQSYFARLREASDIQEIVLISDSAAAMDSPEMMMVLSSPARRGSGRKKQQRPGLSQGPDEADCPAPSCPARKVSHDDLMDLVLGKQQERRKRQPRSCSSSKNKNKSNSSSRLVGSSPPPSYSTSSSSSSSFCTTTTTANKPFNSYPSPTKRSSSSFESLKGFFAEVAPELTKASSSSGRRTKERSNSLQQAAFPRRLVVSKEQQQQQSLQLPLQHPERSASLKEFMVEVEDLLSMIQQTSEAIQ